MGRWGTGPQLTEAQAFDAIIRQRTEEETESPKIREAQKRENMRLVEMLKAEKEKLGGNG